MVEELENDIAEVSQASKKGLALGKMLQPQNVPAERKKWDTSEDDPDNTNSPKNN